MVGAIGLAIEGDVLRAVAISRRRIVWAAEARYETLAGLHEALVQLVGERPAGYRRCHVALGWEIAQCKLIDQLVPRLRRRELEAHARTEHRRYFISPGGPLVVSAMTVGHGACLAAAQAELLDTIAAGLIAAGIETVAIAPTMLWHTNRARNLKEAAALDVGDPWFESALIAAATSRPEGTFAVPALRSRQRHRIMFALRRWMIATAAVAVVSLAVYLGNLSLSIRSHEREFARMSDGAERARLVRGDLDDALAALAYLRSETGVPGRAIMLANITRVLPDSSFLQQLRIETDGRGFMTTYSVNTAATLLALKRVPFLDSANLDGVLTRVGIAGAEFERASVRFAVGRDD